MSKYVEIYFIKKQYDHVIEISELNESLATRINDEVTLSSNLPIVAASYFFKNKIEIAEEYYYKHFKLLLKLKSKKEDFMHPLDGILNCCEVKNNYEKFNDLKKELYSNLLFISCDMMNNKFKESKINQKKSLQDHLNENSIKSNKSQSLFKDNNLQLSIDIFKITYLISKSDGEVHPSEIYDILQSVNAINFSMGEQTEITLKDVKIQKEEIDKLDFNEYHDFVNILSKKITEKHDQSTVRSIYHFCLDIAKADGVIKNSEQMILNIIKDNFDIYEIR
jgi:tellurite resistance protein